jgi:hypothetical protein
MHTSEMIATALYTSDVTNESVRRIVGHYEECNSHAGTDVYMSAVSLLQTTISKRDAYHVIVDNVAQKIYAVHCTML